MKELFANTEAGMIGLILFFILFVCVVLWTLRPSGKSEYKKNGEIPLRED